MPASGIRPRTQDQVVAAARPQVQAQVAEAEVRHQSLSSRLTEQRYRTGVQRLPYLLRDANARTSIGDNVPVGTSRPTYLHARYYDRPDLVLHTRRHIHMYYDPYHRLRHRVIWPSYCYPVYYPFGPHVHVRYVWPHHHRKYVFISLGGWWPYDYAYTRYYWYGYHPYVWYGYYPVAREVVVGGDNYYTYNYYYDDDGSYTSSSYRSSTPMPPSTQADLRARLEQGKAVEPAAPTLTDTRFEEGVKSFEAGDYGAAAVRFEEAMRLAPNDVILPYAYAQALFADGHHDKAADVLREALQKISPEQEGVFFPRGLYANDDVLFGQIEKLLDRIDRSAEDADLRLLLGYQLLGVGEIGHARDQLEQARQDPRNARLAGVLLTLAERMEKEAGPAVKAGGAAAETSSSSSASLEAPVDHGAAPEAPATPDAAESAGTSGAPALPAGTGATAPTWNRLVAPEDAGVAPGPDLDGPAEDNDSEGRAAAMPPDDARPPLETAGLLDGTAAAGLWPSLARLGRSDVPNVKADMVILASILSLALTGLWIEWRVLGRGPA